MLKQAIRIICMQGYNAHTDPLFKKLEVLPLPDLILFFNLQFIHRYTNNLLPTIFQDVWPMNVRNISDNLLQLRNSQDLCLPIASSKQIDRLPFFFLPTEWEKFSKNHIKSYTKPFLFDSNLKISF
jgi:hypothetical protein